ncbi:RDD family protein [Terrabacter sp. MAHUQ-38]|uniref:RDD family protein n=1 Tax=unclassified Terrabacter TaxID=2630222 RepID=UPI00165EA0C7|nr:RDD family protein [Terrabacter sp. MAHUQ-38]
MVDRKDFGSWLEGPRARTSAQEEYRGRDLGLPPSGPGSIAGFGIRLVGVLIDWGIAALIARGTFSVPLPFAQPPATGAQNFVVLGVFALMHLLLVGTIGYTIGHRVAGLQVRSLGGARVMPIQAVVRTILLCLFIPAVVWDRNGRGLHDKVPNTVIVRTR